MLNKIMLIGRLVADPETRVTPSGAQVTSFRIASDRSYRQNEEWKKETLFVRVVTWTNLAKKVSEFYRKGMLVYVEGRLQINSFDKNGQKTWFTDVVAQTSFMLERRNTLSNEEDAPYTGSAPARTGSTNEPLEDQNFEEYDFVPEELEEIA
jgi:single-strand DNA-binding protein